MTKAVTHCFTAFTALLLTLLASCVVPGQEPGMVLDAQETVPFSDEGNHDSGILAKTLVKGLVDPWALAFLPDGHILVTERGGALKLIDPVAFLVTDIGGVPESASAGQGGLMDIRVHPQFERNKLIYLSYTVERDGKYSTRVSRAQLRGKQLLEVEELFTAQPYFEQRRHFGSRLLLDEGYLYITVGDRGNRDLAQSLETHNGKVIRLTEAGEVPIDNPFVSVPGARPEIWSYGHRNPQGIAKHPHNGEIWVAEHGPQGGDEVNRLAPGANYGWPVITYGEEYGGGKIGSGSHADGMEQPLVYWVPSIGTGGMAFYTGELYPGWTDSMLVAGLRLTRLIRMELVGDKLGKETRLMANLDMRFRDVRTGPDNHVYALADGSRLIRLDPVRRDPVRRDLAP
jgi:glucose/arabinose dehydrogenase